VVTTAPWRCAALRVIPYSDVILSGSWAGYVRAWRLCQDRKKIEPAGVLGSRPGRRGALRKGAHDGTNGAPSSHDTEAGGLANGIINDISVFERGGRGDDGLCVVVAVGREHRLGRWKVIKGGRNGAVVFEVPKMARTGMDGGRNSPGDEDAK
jgi:ribosomal RNA-processing protein 9